MFKLADIDITCDLLENIKAISIEEGIEKDRLNAIERVIKAGVIRE